MGVSQPIHCCGPGLLPLEKEPLAAAEDEEERQLEQRLRHGRILGLTLRGQGRLVS